ncbi:DUF5017 domain-containing protein [Niabella hirudinis]|uniref:DUF5017 domain-containing protein n=1 Tax=Niabella hirudinis TaxID=1285929 RepID=UPI003EBF10E1
MRIYSIILIFGAIIAISCNKKMELSSVAFDVTTDSAAYTVGNVTTFHFLGKPDNITFFSGETGHNYVFRGRTAAEGAAQLKFISALNSGLQPNSLSLMISTDFAGNVTSTSDPAAIAAATWTDISGRATWAANATATASGTVDLSDIAAAGKPVYIAFKYTATSGTVQNKWTITGFSLRNVLDDGTAYILDTLPTFATVTNYGNTSNLPGWAAKAVANTYRWTLNATSLVIAGASTAGAATDPAEAWAITGPVDLRKVTPDAGVIVKTMANAVPSFDYIYTKAGMYDAVFIAGNANADGQKSEVKTVSVKVQ